MQKVLRPSLKRSPARRDWLQKVQSGLQSWSASSPAWKPRLQKMRDIALFLLKQSLFLLLLNILFLLLLSLVQLINKEKIRTNTLSAIQKKYLVPRNHPVSPFGYKMNTYDECISLSVNPFPLQRSMIEAAVVPFTVFRCEHLAPFLTNPDSPHKRDYSRYWHGYQIYLRPLMALTTLDNVRILTSFIIIVLIYMTFFVLQNVLGTWVSLVMLGSMFFFMDIFSYAVASTASSLQFIVTLISSMCVVFLSERKFINLKALFFLFLLTGAIITFLGFAQLVSSIPALMVFIFMAVVYSKKERPALGMHPLLVACLCICFFFFGYFFTSSMKWVLASLYGNEQIIGEVTKRVKLWTGSTQSNSFFTNFPHATKTVLAEGFKSGFKINLMLLLGSFSGFLFISKVFQTQGASGRLQLIKQFLILSSPVLLIIAHLDLFRYATKFHLQLYAYRGTYFLLIIPIASGILIGLKDANHKEFLLRMFSLLAKQFKRKP